MTTKNRYYEELIELPTFEERFDYLKLGGLVGEVTFGGSRYLNQILYTSKEWRAFRDSIILRDMGLDLGLLDTKRRLHVHHINPITKDDILERSPAIFDPNNVITTDHLTHKAIHYGDLTILNSPVFVDRSPNDTCPWKGGAR